MVELCEFLQSMGVEIAGAGHVVNLAAPQAFNAALGAFLARLA